MSCSVLSLFVRTLLALSLPMLLSATVTAQHATWYIGPTGVGLRFSPAGVVVIHDGAKDAGMFEGGSTAFDPVTGDVRFYTNGLRIIGPDHTTMDGGTLINVSNSFAQTLIVERPGRPGTHDVFTPEMQVGTMTSPDIPRGIVHTVVDCSLNGGRGAVVQPSTSISPQGVCEMLTAVPHRNGTDRWIIAHAYGSNEFYCWLLTKDGITTPPMVTAIGPTILTTAAGTPAQSRWDAIGELKASPDGTRLAFTTFYSGTTCLFRFDAATGAISDPRPLDLEVGGYGVAFSRNSQRLYISGNDFRTSTPSLSANGRLYQFDIQTYDSRLMQRTRTTLANNYRRPLRSLQLGPDGRIYVAVLDSLMIGASRVGVIEHPDLVGADCRFDIDAIDLQGARGSWGLNNTVTEIAQQGEAPQPSTTSITIHPQPADRRIWVYGRSSSSVDDIVDIFDVHGQRHHTGSGTASIDVSSLPSGLYCVRYRAGEYQQMLPMVIAR